MHLFKHTFAMLFSLLILATPASAQLDAVDKIADGASRLIYLAKTIKELIVEPVDRIDSDKKATADSFEIVARDADGKVVDVSVDEARKLYKWTAKDSSGKIVSQKGTIENLKAADDKLSRTRNVLKLINQGSSKAVKLEMRLADQYAAYSAASGSAAIAKPVAAAKTGGMVKWIASHPYWSAAGGVAVVGGAAAAGGSGGGSSDTSSSTSDGGGSSSATIADSGASATPTNITGHWSGHAGTDSITFNLVQSDNTFSGTHTTVPAPGNGPTNSGTVSGTITGNSFSMTLIFSDGSPVAVGIGTVSGNSMSGSWTKGQDSGSWSATKN